LGAGIVIDTCIGSNAQQEGEIRIAGDDPAGPEVRVIGGILPEGVGGPGVELVRFEVFFVNAGLEILRRVGCSGKKCPEKT
jgi:hypothetical protein